MSFKLCVGKMLVILVIYNRILLTYDDIKFIPVLVNLYSMLDPF